MSKNSIVFKGFHSDCLTGSFPTRSGKDRTFDFNIQRMEKGIEICVSNFGTGKSCLGLDKGQNVLFLHII